MRQNSLTFLLAIIVVLLLSVASSVSGADLKLEKISDAKPMNVVFILSDDHRYDVMGFLDHPWVETPAMDAMASEGVYF
ncbi:MAG: acetylglucosamine-6-sulfatase, partial [Gimesia sp.]|nr:acetylglucosamine-6-sulfatase [Gimesia sp.]